MTYWENKISHITEDINWVEVTSRVEIQPNSQISLEYDGFKIKVMSDTDEELLKKVVRVLRCI